MKLVLIGLRGCGKTTIGRRLVSEDRFVDLDALVLDRFEEATVGGVWAAHGEAAWRSAEAEVLTEVLSREGRLVVALGGGAPTVEAVRRLLEAEQSAGRLRVIYLRCRAEELARRLRADLGDRPSITGADPVQEIESVFAARDPLYRRLADVEIDVTGTSPAAAAEAVRRA